MLGNYITNPLEFRWIVRSARDVKREQYNVVYTWGIKRNAHVRTAGL